MSSDQRRAAHGVQIHRFVRIVREMVDEDRFASYIVEPSPGLTVLAISRMIRSARSQAAFAGFGEWFEVTR